MLDSLEGTRLFFELEHGEGSIAVSGKFVHPFWEEQSARILKKKSVLNRTFAELGIAAKADTDIGVDSIEEGHFTISLGKKIFDVSSGDYEAVREYMIRFMKTIAIIQNTESYE